MATPANSATHMSTLKKISLIAKGKSAELASSIICDDDDVGSINDGFLLTPKKHIDYVFFSDLQRTKHFAKNNNRIGKYVSRELLDHEVKEVPDCVKSKWSVYPHRGCCGDYDSLNARLISGGLMWHHSTPGAIHYLAKVAAYKTIKVIGVDGTTTYAKGTDSTQLFEGIDPSLFRIISRRVASICARVYGCQIIWYDIQNPNGETISS
jgi:hypothetical protein